MCQKSDLTRTISRRYPPTDTGQQQDQFHKQRTTRRHRVVSFCFLLSQRMPWQLNRRLLPSRSLHTPFLRCIYLIKLDRMQNEAVRVILGTTKDTPTKTMRFMLDLPPMKSRQKVEQVKAYFSAVENPHNPLHEAVKDTKGSRLRWGKSWMGQAEESVLQVCQLAELQQNRCGSLPIFALLLCWS